ncbi:MAG: right-handed parallel beta-helix repeat-containing protein [Bacillota bacterium]
MSIQSLIDAATPGSIVNVSAGIYNEQLLINKPLTLQGPPIGLGSATIDATGLANIPTIQILSSDVVIQRLTLQNGPSHGLEAGSSIFPNLSNIVISNNTIQDHGNAGILTNHSAAMKISNNIIKNNGLGSGFNRVGIVLYPHGPTTINGNTITNNAIDGIFARGSDTGLLITNNLIENHPNSGITLAWDQRNTTITNNHIKNCGTGNFDEEGGIVIIQSMAEIIQGNIIDDCQYSGIFWGWVPTIGDPPDEILISDNKIKGSSRDAIYLFSQGPGGFIPADKFPLSPKIQGNILSHSGRAGVYVSNVYYYGPGNANPIINHNQILNNDWGVLNATVAIVNAIENWWGESNGPYHPVLNPQGTGNPVSNNVDFIPWSIEPPSIQAATCSIKEVALEKYDILPLANGLSKVTLIMKTRGNACSDINGNQFSTDFETWFSKSFVAYAPKSTKVRPSINYTATCYATPVNNILQIEMELCIVVNIQGRYDLLLPSWGFLPVPLCSENCNPNDHSPLAAEYKNDEISSIECISVDMVFDSCWFTKSLFCNIALP